VVSRTSRSVVSTTTAINAVPNGTNIFIAIKATIRIVEFIAIIRIITCLNIICTVTCLAIIRIVKCIDIIRIIPTANDNAFHNCFARCIASLITIISLNTIAISHDTTAAVNFTYTAAAAAAADTNLVPDIILTLEFTDRLRREGKRGIATKLNACISILFPMSKSAHRISHAILQKAQNVLNTSLSFSSFFYLPR